MEKTMCLNGFNFFGLVKHYTKQESTREKFKREFIGTQSTMTFKEATTVIYPVPSIYQKHMNSSSEEQSNRRPGLTEWGNTILIEDK